jgi:hypothetical protein
MADIQVLDDQNRSLGKGSGVINPPNAQIATWTNKAGLRANQAYKLKSQGTVYTALCNQVGPPATFVDVE